MSAWPPDDIKPFDCTAVADDQTVVSLFERAAQRWSHRLAVRELGGTTSYADLAADMDRIAAAITAGG